MRIIKVKSCGECPLLDTDYSLCEEGWRRGGYEEYKTLDIRDQSLIHDECPLEDMEIDQPENKV